MQGLGVIHLTVLLGDTTLLGLASSLLHQEPHFGGYAEVGNRYQNDLLQHGILAELMRSLDLVFPSQWLLLVCGSHTSILHVYRS